jgi:hypothetical protein
MKTRLIVLAVAVLAFAVVAMAADDPFVGTWKMNLAKSKFSDPSSAPKSYISSVESLKNGMFKYVRGCSATPFRVYLGIAEASLRYPVPSFCSKSTAIVTC